MTDRLIEAAEIEKALSWLNKYWKRLIHPEYHNARTIDEAVSLLDTYGEEARVLAGGIDLIGLMKNKVLLPGVLINIKSIPDMKYIVEDISGINIGALTPINDMERSCLIRSKYPVLFEAAHAIGAPQIRNMSTIAGNLCQDVRCWYYRRSPVTGITFNCRRKTQEGVCYAVNGENQYHAILGATKCFAVCPSDMAIALLALGAKVNTVNTSGERVIPMENFYTTFGNVLEPGEIITAIQVPEVGSEVKQRFLKFRLRNTYDFAIASVATVIKLKNGIVNDARIVLGGVSPTPYRALKAEEALIGKRITKDIVAKVAETSVSESVPLSKNGYKVTVVETLIKRALLE